MAMMSNGQEESSRLGQRTPGLWRPLGVAPSRYWYYLVEGAALLPSNVDPFHIAFKEIHEERDAG